MITVLQILADGAPNQVYYSLDPLQFGAFIVGLVLIVTLLAILVLK